MLIFLLMWSIKLFSVCAFELLGIIPRNTHDDNQTLLGNILNGSGAVGSESLPSVVFPLLIAREIKPLELHHHVCAVSPGTACAHSRDGTEQGEAWPYTFSPEVWHNFSNRKHHQNNQIPVLLPDIDKLVGFILIFPYFPCLSWTGRSSRVPLPSCQPSRCVKVWDGGCF